MLLKSRASLTCFWACFLPGWAKDLISIPVWSGMLNQSLIKKKVLCFFVLFWFLYSRNTNSLRFALLGKSCFKLRSLNPALALTDYASSGRRFCVSYSCQNRQWITSQIALTGLCSGHQFNRLGLKYSQYCLCVCVCVCVCVHITCRWFMQWGL